MRYSTRMDPARSTSLRRVFAACAVVALAAGCAQKPQRGPRQTGDAVVPVVKARYGAVAPKTILSGMVTPLQNVGITSTLAEPADDVNVQEGDRVRRGQVLAQLDTADLRAQLAADLANAQSSRAKATQTYDQAGLTITQQSNVVNAARAAVRAAQQTLANDRLTLQRDAALLRQGYLAQAQYDQQATAVKNDEQAVQTAQVTLQNDVSQVKANGTTASGLQGANVAAAQADVQTALAQADQVRVQIAKATIVAPIDGVVVNRNLNPGEFPGSRTLFTLQATDRVYAALNGSGSQISGIRNGETVALSSDAHPGTPLRGTVVGVLNAVQPGTTNFVVKVLVDNARGLLRPGMVVTGTAPLPGARGIRIPATAFLDTTDSTVQIVRNGAASTVHVTTLAQDGKNAIVVGLPEGAPVIANGQLGLADGQHVATEGKQQQHRRRRQVAQN
jgi:HlyD family secretion protein